MTNCDGSKMDIKFNAGFCFPNISPFTKVLFIRPDPLTDDTELDKSNGYYRSKGEFGIKALRNDTFAILYIPKNAAIHVGDIGDEASRLYLINILGTSEGDPRRFSAEYKSMLKHRANKAYIVDICKIQLNTTEVDQNSKSASVFRKNADYGYSIHDSDFLYKTGEWIEIDNFEYLSDEECASGVHYFPSAIGAAKYTYIDSVPAFLTRDLTFSGVIMQRYLMFSLCGEILKEWMDSMVREFKKTSDIFEQDHGFHIFLDDWDWINGLRTALGEVTDAVASVHNTGSNTAPTSSTVQTYLKNDELATKELGKFSKMENKPP